MKPFQPPTARATRAIIIACIAVQVAMTLAGTGVADAVALRAALIPARLTGAVALPGAVPAPLTLLTSLFLHANWLHLAMNMFFLGFVGRLTEWVIGPARFVALYAAGGIAGGLLQVAVAPQSIVPVLGASGAIAAVFAAYAVLFARSRAAERTLLGVTLSAELLSALWLAAAWIGVQLLIGLVLNMGGDGIAIWAHIGGFLAGLALARPLSRRARVRPL